jgi:pimeloyl-ACP methyl ester carboxylesterase
MAMENSFVAALNDTVASKTFAYIVVAWIVVEIMFAICVYFVILPELNKLKPPPPYHGDIVTMMKKTFDEVKSLKSYTFEMYVSGFCNGAKFEDIHIDNFRSFLAWGMFHKYLNTVTPQEAREIDEVLEYIESQHPEIHNLKPGMNPAVSNCSMTLEPLPIIHRPLILYVTVNLMETLANAVFLRACGFHSMEHDGMHYWYSENGGHDGDKEFKHSSDGSEPLVFLHGISTGWMLYMNIVKALGAKRTLILVDLNAIKIKSLHFDMPTPEQFVKRVNGILQKHRITQASFVGHSFGSVTAGWFVRYFPDKVSHLTLIDPVTILLSFPEVAYSFLYREPTTLMEWIIHLTAARELTVSHTLRRHFWWYNNALWLEDVPARIGIVIGVSSRDEIIHPQAVYEYTRNCRELRLQARRDAIAPRRITRSRSNLSVDSAGSTTVHATQSVTKPPIAMIECVIWEGYSHGQILLPTQAQRQFVKMVRGNEKIGSVY